MSERFAPKPGMMLIADCHKLTLDWMWPEVVGAFRYLTADDEFLPGTAYANWFDDERNIIETGLGPVQP
ncbi:hypothetical protein GC207_05615 [bacterium]|nr:hypothetical protein [bacterium]